MRRGTIRPRSVRKLRKSPTSLKSIEPFSMQNRQGRRRWKNRPPPPLPPLSPRPPPLPPRSRSRSIKLSLIQLLRFFVFIAGIIVWLSTTAATLPSPVTAFGHKRHGLRDDFVLAALLAVFCFPAPLL